MLRALWLVHKVVIINELHWPSLPFRLYCSFMRRDHCQQFTWFYGQQHSDSSVVTVDLALSYLSN